MKRSNYTRILLFMLLAGSIAFSCAKKTTPPTNNAPQYTAKLQVQVIKADGNGQAQLNPKVQLFLTDADRANKTNPASNLRTGDANGLVNFDSLQPVVYYYNAYSNDMTLSNAGQSNSTSKLVNGQLNKIQVGVK